MQGPLEFKIDEFRTLKPFEKPLDWLLEREKNQG